VDLTTSAHQEELRSQLRLWLRDNLPWEYGNGLPPRFDDLDEQVHFLTRWQERLASERWVGITWPITYGGRGLGPAENYIVTEELARARAPELIGRIGINLAGPTLLAYGTKEQASRWLSKILTAEELWCQLFSEPGAGSDLASLSTKARKVDGGWELTGQKVWTSYAQFADWGICLARSDPDAPKHKGLSFFVVDMRQAGIEVRPLIQITGEAEFNEVFLDRVFVQDDCLIGDPGEGWKVATTTLAHERGTSFAFKEEVVHESYLNRLFEYAISSGEIESPGISSALADVFVALLVLRCHNWRTLSRLSRSVSPGAESSIVKLAWTEVTQRLSDLALELCSDDDIAGAVDVSRPSAPRPVDWERQWLWSRSASIAGGTSEIQRTIIGERLLGLER
jgi:alkylation response protein AidB-like acyl-CoA dehydrogenase